MNNINEQLKSVWEMTKQYVIKTGPDGLHWVSLEPLNEDLKRAIDSQDIQDRPDVQLNMMVVQAFINALISEGLQQDYRDEMFIKGENDE